MSDVKLYSWNSRGMIEQPDGKWVRLDDHNALRAKVEALRAKLEAARICTCREPWAPDTVHRTDGPCYMAEPLAAKVRAAASQPPEGQKP